MAGGAGHHHRSGPLKQQNKAHKQGKHRSKGQLDNEFKGRVAKGSGSHRAKAEASKQDRKNRAKQIRDSKRADLLQQHRAVGGLTGAPQLVALVSLCPGADVRGVRNLVIRACMDGVDDDVRGRLEAGLDAGGQVTVLAQRLKNRMTLLEVPQDVIGLLEIAKACDTMVFVMRSDEAPTEEAELALSAVKAMGMPAPVVVVQGMEEVPHKRRGDVRKALMKYLDVHFPAEERFFQADTEQDGSTLLRHLVTRRREGAAWRSIRPYVIADDAHWTSQDMDQGTGTLAITGFVRGGSLDVNKLVHLPYGGDFQLDRIESASDPYGYSKGRHKGQEEDMREAEGMVLATADPEKQQDLVAYVEPDMLDQEQTFPTEEELQQADEAFHAAQKKTVRVPKGTSAYQAAWIVEDALSGEDSDFTDIEDDDDDVMDMGRANDDARSYAGSDYWMAVSGDEGAESGSSDEEEYEDLAVDGEQEKYDKAQEYEDEAAELKRIRAERALEDLEFPDEIDTPMDQPARVRFQKFRGLQSFRTSPWDPKENLPIDYARIFQFEDFQRTAKRVVKEARRQDAVAPGSFVTIFVRNVPLHYLDARSKDVPLVVVGLLPYENKMSVVNFALKRHMSSEELVVRNKEELVYVTPIRTFCAGTVLSQHTRNDKHKMEAFFHIARPTIATVYAPIHFGAMPTLVFYKHGDGHLQLLATGSIHSVNPDRLVLKKYILTGHPFKINVKTATVRYMFFNRVDIAWFKPVELFTKYGLRGHIKEPLGTHGHMKCSFNGKLKAQDTICMSLYKRVFPKWTYAQYHPQSQHADQMLA